MRLHNDSGAPHLLRPGRFRGNRPKEDDIASVIERSSNMWCVRGERLSGDNVQTAIIDRSGVPQW